MKKKLLLLLLLAFSGIIHLLHAQDDAKPKGTVLARLFLDAGYQHPSQVALDLTRAYLGYNYTFAPHFEAQIVADFVADKSERGIPVALLKNAFVHWRTDKYTLSAGIIPLTQFRLSERMWGQRYVQKAFADEYDFGHSADLGIMAQYYFSPAWSMDVSLQNGEGYKRFVTNKSFRYALGSTIKPVENVTLRAYADTYIYTSDLKPADAQSDAVFAHQYSVGLFGAYQTARLTVGIDYNHQFNHQFMSGSAFYGGAIFGTLRLDDRWLLFGRVDKLFYTRPDWGGADESSSRAGTYAILGGGYAINQYCKIAPNVRLGHHDLSGTYDYSLFLNFEFNLRHPL